MENQYSWEKSTGWFDSRKGIQVSVDSDNVELRCVEKSVVGKVVSAIADFFGFSTSYGISTIPRTSSVSILLPGNSDDVYKRILPIIQTFLHSPHPPIGEAPANEVLNGIISDIYRSVYGKIAKKEERKSSNPEAQAASVPIRLSEPGDKPGEKRAQDELSLLKKRDVKWHQARSKDDTDLPSREDLDTSPLKTRAPALRILVELPKETPPSTSKEVPPAPEKEKVEKSTGSKSQSLLKTIAVGFLFFLGGKSLINLQREGSTLPEPPPGALNTTNQREGSTLPEPSPGALNTTNTAELPTDLIAPSLQDLILPRHSLDLDEEDGKELDNGEELDIEPPEALMEEPPLALPLDVEDSSLRGSVVDLFINKTPLLSEDDSLDFKVIQEGMRKQELEEAAREERAEKFAKKVDVMREVGRTVEQVEWEKIIYRDGSFYEGAMDWINDRPSGIGVLKDKEGNVVLEGKWKKGVIEDGKGTVVLDAYSLFTGPIRDGLPAGAGIKRTGEGEELYVVEGYGTLQLENGDVYVGNIEGHSPAGYGEVRSKEGDLIKEGIFHGTQLVKEMITCPFEDAGMFRGEVDKQGRPDGFGVVFSDQGIFFGNFKAGKLLGERPKPKKTNMLLFTSYTANRASFNKPVIDNHEEYAEEHGYHYVKFIENLAADFETTYKQELGNTLPYWSKIAGMIRLLHLLNPSKFPEEIRQYLPKELIWFDDDAVITNFSIKIEDVVNYYAPPGSETHLFLTQDIMHAAGYDLNTALLFARNSPESRSIFSEIWGRRLKKVDRGTYGNCPDQSCLHEQAALQDLMKLETYGASKHVRIISQRDRNDPVGGWGVNTFDRESHIDYGRGSMELNYNGDDPVGRWRPKDFIGQATGMASDGELWGGERGNLRELYMLHLVNEAEKTKDKKT